MLFQSKKFIEWMETKRETHLEVCNNLCVFCKTHQLYIECCKGGVVKPDDFCTALRGKLSDLTTEQKCRREILKEGL